jgi:hypothetical protein
MSRFVAFAVGGVRSPVSCGVSKAYIPFVAAPVAIMSWRGGGGVDLVNQHRFPVNMSKPCFASWLTATRVRFSVGTCRAPGMERRLLPRLRSAVPVPTAVAVELLASRMATRGVCSGSFRPVYGTLCETHHYRG